MLFRGPAAAFLLGLAAYLPAFAARPLPPSVYDSLNHRSIRVFSDQLHGGLTEAEARFAATHYVGVQKMTLPDIRRIRSYNENFIHLHYKLGVSVDSIADYGMVLNGQWFDDNRSVLSNWGQVRSHPDWFFLDSKGGWTIHENRRIVMDITKPGFREWWVNSCIQEMQGNECDGVFADTYTVEAIGFRTNNPFFESTTSLTSTWIPALNDYGKYVYTRLDSAGYYFFPNIDNLQTNWVANAGAHYYKGDFLHAAMMESWGDWASAQDAQFAISKLPAIQNKGVFIHGEGYFGGSNFPNPGLTTAQQRMWLAGTYLLTNNGHMYLSMYGTEAEMSGRVLWFPEYELDLGRWNKIWNSLPDILWGSVFRREYEKGWVLCNINDADKTVTLPDTMYLAQDDGTTSQYWADAATGMEKVGLAYTPVTSLTLPRMSAAVLLFSPPAGGCTMPLAGDYDGNGRVELRDAVWLARALRDGSTDPCLDYNGDGRAGILDILALILHIAVSH